MTTYKYISDSVVAKIDDDGISRSSCSTDYHQYLAWLAEGNTPEPVDPPVVIIPSVVSMRQARLALLKTGMLAEVQSAITSMIGPEGEAARITWEFSSEVRRDHPLVEVLSSVLGLTGEQLDNLFITAGQQ